ncbi:helix-turn-helix transcriptional regulator [Pseudorhodoferax sp.]|uniref:helix-turn-helix transcriptional regulator n=1 Tax=Pseudorhodoferax sp. TaxID=1993553 RepID=UPI0039E3FC1B
MLSEWLRTLASEGVDAIVVLGPDLHGGPDERRVLAVHPLDAQHAAHALVRDADFGDGPSGPVPSVVAWHALDPAASSNGERDWRRPWHARGARSTVRVNFELPAGRAFECFLFVAHVLQQRTQVAVLAWLAQNFWPTLRAALVAAWCPLTPREQECLRLAFDGLTARASAERMACTERTVNFHLANAMAKLDVDNKMAAIQRACWLGAI